MTITRDDWLRAMEEVGLPTIPSGDDQDAITIADFADQFQLHRYTASRRLHSLVKAGKAIRTTKFTTASDGRVMRHTAYKLLDTPEKRR